MGYILLNDSDDEILTMVIITGSSLSLAVAIFLFILRTVTNRYAQLLSKKVTGPGNCLTIRTVRPLPASACLLVTSTRSVAVGPLGSIDFYHLSNYTQYNVYMDSVFLVAENMFTSNLVK